MQKKIFLDPGHGDRGKDFGAIGKDGTKEADITLKIAKLTEKLLEEKDYEVHMSRECIVSNYPLVSEKLGDLPYRAKEANDLECDLFISIHCNAAGSSDANGTEVFHAGSVEGKKLAKCVLNEVLYIQKQKKNRYKLTDKEKYNLWNFKNRGVKQDKFYVLTNTDMPAILIETLFLSNPEDLKLLKQEEFQKAYAMAIIGGIEKYYKGK